MGEYKPWADRLSDELDAFFRLWRDRRWFAILLVIAVIGFCAFFVVRWFQIGEINEDLQQENTDLKRDFKQIEAENKGLRETVAPLLVRAAKEFPGEEINDSLKKIIAQLESQNPLQQPIVSATATVELTIKSEMDVNTHYMSKGGYAVFGRGTTPLLKASSIEARARQTGQGKVRYSGNFSMPADDIAAGKPIEFLKDAQYLQTAFIMMPEDSQVIEGKIIFVINDSMRLKFFIPPQQSDGIKVYVRDLSEGLKPLYTE